jgi:hypothetical protein
MTTRTTGTNGTGSIGDTTEGTATVFGVRHPPPFAPSGGATPAARLGSARDGQSFRTPVEDSDRLPETDR